MVHGYACITHRGNQVVSGLALNILVSGLTAVLGIAWFARGGRTPQLPGDARFLPLEWPGASALREVPGLGADLQRAPERPQPDRLPRLPGRAGGGVGAVPHALRVAPACLRRESALGGHGGHLGASDCATGALLCTGVACGVAGTYLSLAQSAGFINDMTAGKGLHRACRADFRQVASGARDVRLPAVRLPGRGGHPAAGGGRSRHRGGAGTARAGAALRADRGACWPGSSAGRFRRGALGPAPT